MMHPIIILLVTIFMYGGEPQVLEDHGAPSLEACQAVAPKIAEQLSKQDKVIGVDARCIEIPVKQKV